jgi:hypothetical protein
MYSIDLTKIQDNSNNSEKPIGFIQEDFHSEVLDFLFELLQNRKLILYNNTDRYGNKSLYIQKYKNLQIKDLNHFIPDLTFKKLHKLFVISHDNIFHLKLLESFKDNIIFIAHSKKHIQSYNNLNMNYFSLTPLLCTDNYMLPIINKTTFTKDTENTENTENINIFNLNKNWDYLKNLCNKNNLHIIITVGYFIENNRNLKLIEELLNSKKIMLIAFTPEISKELNHYISKYPQNIFTAIGISTELLKHSISYLNINHLLFCPPPNSTFFKESWSGTLAFGFDNNLKVIIPEEIVQIYDFKNDHVVQYKNANDIIDCIFNNKIIFNTDLQSWKNQIFSRNIKIISSLIK